MRGLKSVTFRYAYSPLCVAPYIGAWIEIKLTLPSIFEEHVAPYIGAWIEIPDGKEYIGIAANVAPYIGAWIEI